MPEADAARAFDRFHRSAHQQAQDQGRAHQQAPDQGRAHQQAPDHSQGRGSGLGLSIVAAIAHAHGGQATLESRPGEGTRVRIWLPERASP
jgi:signal transduction histidine kinase